MQNTKSEDIGTYEKYGYKGVALDMIYGGYFSYNFANRMDDLTYILFDRFYLTPRVKKSPLIKPLYTGKECVSHFYENYKKIREKMRNRNYNISEEEKELRYVLSDMDSKNFFII